MRSLLAKSGVLAVDDTTPQERVGAFSRESLRVSHTDCVRSAAIDQAALELAAH